MSLRLSLLVLVVSAVNAQAQTPNVTGPQPEYQFKEKDIPVPLKRISFDLPITCTARKVAVAGYGMDVNELNSQGALYEDVNVRVDSEPTSWKITVHGDKADVIISGWSSNDITETWTVASKTDDYLILMRIWDKQIRTITINAKYATFVHCFNGEPLFVNYGAIFWGTCSN
jgi:hypothetical protein